MTGHFALLDLPDTHIRALKLFLNRMSPNEYVWALTGSASLRLQGVDTPVHDLDIQADEKTVYIMEKQLAGFMKTPVHFWESTGMRSLDGKAVIDGVEIELLANIARRKPDGSWCTFTDFSHLVWVETHGLRIPLFPLEDELEAYEAMGRTDKVGLIRRAIQKACR